jgi:hypothetical protein
MEKNKQVFDVDLNSMLGTPIEVESAQDGLFPEAIMTVGNNKDKEKEVADKKATEEAEKDLIDLDSDEEIDNEEESEEEGDDENEDTLEESSSTEKEQSPQKGKSKTSSPLTPYAKLLVEEGVLPNLDIKKFDGTADSLKEAMVEEIVGMVNNYKESLPPRIKHLINNYEEGISFEKLLDLDKVETDISKVTPKTLEEDVTLQKKLVGDYLKRTTKFSDTKISKLVDGYEDSGDLEDEAKTSLTELKSLVESEKKNELAEIERQKVEGEAQRKKDLITLQEKVKATNEIIPGLKLNEKIKGTVFSSMTTPVGYDQVGRPVNRIVAARMENPVEFEIKLHYLFEVTKGFTDFSKLAEKGKRDATKSFETAVSQLDNTNFEEGEKTPKELGKKGEDFLKSLHKVYKL